MLALGHLVGPLRVPGWRGAIASVSKEKAGELRNQVAGIVEASGLSGQVRIRRSPYPGVIESAWGSLETLASERTAGHSSSFDLVIVDETGLMPERARELLAGLRSSVSAKGGRVIHISVRGDSPLFGEILDNPATIKRVYAAPEGCAIDDPAAWHAANPGIAAGIKQLGYMAHEVNRVRGAPSDEPSFRAFDLNQNLDPTREMILSPGRFAPVLHRQSAAARGPVLPRLRLRGGYKLDRGLCGLAGDGAVGNMAGVRRHTVACRTPAARLGALRCHGGPGGASDLSGAHRAP